MVVARGLVGREVELAALGTALRQLAEGRSSTLVIEGEAGIGKTSLIERLVGQASASGVTTYAGHAHPFERTRPFGVVATALGLNRRSPDPRRAALAELLAGQGAADRPVDGGDLLYRVVEEIVDLVETSCGEGPVLLVAEDVHWADSASLLALSALARQIPLSPLLVVVTARPAPLSAEVARLLDELSAGGSHSVRLRPLTPSEDAALATRVLGAPPGPVLTALLAKAGGNPLWLEAMLRSLADEGLLDDVGGVVETTTSELPASLTDLVVRRLRHLSPATLELLQITAVLGDTVSLRDVAAVARRSPTDVVRDLGDAFDAQLLDEAVDRVVFRHQLVQDAIYHHVPAPARRVLHRDAALALMDAGADRLDVANHLVLGAERGDEQAVTWLRGAAREASLRAPMLAVELVRRAEVLLPAGHPDADPVSAEVVFALMRAGQVAEATDRAEAVLARHHAAEVDVPLRLALLGGLALQNRAAEVISLAQASLVGAASGRPVEQVPILAHQSWALTFSGEPRAGEGAALRALRVAEDAGDAARTVSALTPLLVAEGRQGRYPEALAHARRAAEVAELAGGTGSLPLQPKLFLGLALFDCDLVADARAAYRSALDDEFGSAWWLSDTLMADAQVSFVIGDWDDAVPRLIASGQAAREKDHPLLESQALAHRAIIATATGNHRAATALLDQIVAVPDGEPPRYNAGVVAHATAGVRAAEGDRVGAYDLLLRCWRDDAVSGNRFYHRCVAPDLVRLALALGHREVAVEVADAVDAGAALAPEVPTVRSVARRCRGLVEADADALLEGVAVVRGVPHLVEHAGACEDAAAVLILQGHGAEAAPLLAEALERHERAGASAWAARVRARLRELGVHPGQRGSRERPTHGWESLTETERAVSLLVAEGLTNGAVARRLYMSPHTVNTHLRHVFAKLDVSNRVALAGIVHRTIE